MAATPPRSAACSPPRRPRQDSSASIRDASPLFALLIAVMLEGRGGDAKRHIGACGVKPVSSFGNRERPESLGAVDGNVLGPLGQLEGQLQAELQDARNARGADLVGVCNGQGVRRAGE